MNILMGKSQKLQNWIWHLSEVSLQKMYGKFYEKYHMERLQLMER